MRIEFSKMHGLGNDFMVIDAINQSISLSQEQVRFLSNRRTGVGFDQLLLVESPDHEDADFRYRIYNADGGEVEQCGNGARCFARFVRDRGLTEKTLIPVNTSSGVIQLKVLQDGQVRVDMGKPEFEPEKIPFDSAARHEKYVLEVANESIEVGVVSMGNPHAVMLVSHIDRAPVLEYGPMIETHDRFPNRVNAGFMQVVDDSHIHLRVYERGTGETLACGTGACAAVVIGRLWGMLSEEVEVTLPGGRLVIRWPNSEDTVLMTGPVAHVFDGELDI
ncbi:MAG: diaminopimelate epimerase [Gammaproteobacteria bacterium]|nr:MAG: diaminopimelate epimerase [Gammaproteobacteria bacterium]